jgi:hypothetical protein
LICPVINHDFYNLATASLRRHLEQASWSMNENFVANARRVLFFLSVREAVVSVWLSCIIYHLCNFIHMFISMCTDLTTGPTHQAMRLLWVLSKDSWSTCSSETSWPCSACSSKEK